MTIHASDCAIHREPAFPAGPCNCGASTVISWDRFREAQEKKRDPKGYEAKKIHEAIDKQVKASEPLLVNDTPLLDEGHDDAEVSVFERGVLWGIAGDYYEKQRLLDRYLSEQQGDPGDEA